MNDITAFLNSNSENIKLGLIILGWLAIPYFNHRLTKKRERAALINKNIDNIESAFKDINQLVLEQLDKRNTDISIYYKLIDCNQKVLLNSKRLSKIDNKLKINFESISKIRKYSTNDKIINELGHPIMRRLSHEQMNIIKSYPQQH